MVRVCPRCRALSQGTFLCPRCGIQTNEVESGSGKTEAGTTVALPEPPTIANGLLIGLLTAQGLTYALSHLTSAWLLSHGGPEAESAFRGSFAGTAASQTIQAVAVVAGAIFAGACQARPLIVGVILGVLNALLLFAFQIVLRQKVEPIVLYVQPALHAFLGGLAASLGARIWQPAPGLPAIAAKIGPGHEALTTILPDRQEESIDEPIAWGRVFLGLLISMVGTFGARWIRDFVVIAGGGTGTEMQQSQFITWQIGAVAQILGGVIAGANSRSGATSGFWVGLFAAVLVVLAPALANVRMQSHEVAAWLLGFSVPEGSPAAFIIQGIQTLVFGIFGGWLGSLILPVRIVKRTVDASS